MKTVVIETTNQSIQAVLAGAPAANQPEFTVTYVDIDTTVTPRSYTPKNANGVLNGTTDATLVSAPAASHFREITEIVIYNADTSPVTVTVKLVDTATARRFSKKTLAAGESWTLSNFDAPASAGGGGGSPGGAGSEVQYRGGASTFSGAAGSSVDANGIVNLVGLGVKVVSKTADYPAANESAILVDATAGNVTITLPAAASNANRLYLIKKTDATANTVIIDGNASELINGAATLVLNFQNSSVIVQCDGTGWHVF